MPDPVEPQIWTAPGGIDLRNCKPVIAQSFSDSRAGWLSVLTANQQVPFSIERVYYMSGLDSNAGLRGNHAHRAEEQVLQCIAGACTVSLDDGTEPKSIRLLAGPVGIYIGRLVWHSMADFAENSALLVLASEPYDESDYVRDYTEFCQLVDQRHSGEET